MGLLSDCVSASVSMQNWNFFNSLMFLQAATQKLTEWTDIVQNRLRKNGKKLFDSGQRGFAAFLEEINMLLFLQNFFEESGYFAGFHLPRYALNCFPTKGDFQFRRRV
jgi:hypothetical protein